MGCSPCHSSTAEATNENPSDKKHKLPMGHYSDGRRGVAPTKSLKLKKSSYVVVSSARLGDIYSIQEKIGEGECHAGGFGNVYRAMHKKLGFVRAVKSLDRRALPKAQRKQLLFEVDLLKEMDHPNILKIYEVIKDDIYYHVVTEMLTGGELFVRISEGVRYSEGKIASYMQQILSAVHYCHGKRIIHRDLKPENLIFEDQSENSLLKVIDFGASCTYDESSKGMVGTAYYIAPEILKSHTYDEKCDIWSCGIILYMLLCGYPPFNGSSELKIHRKILNNDVPFPGKFHSEEEWSSVSSDAKEVVSLMLRKNPVRRPSAWDLLNHPWIQRSGELSLSTRAISVAVLTRLKDFRVGSKMRQAALQMITSQFTEDSKVQEMRDVFMELDADKDGRLSREELIAGFKMHKVGSVEEVDRIMEMCDADHSGSIELTEFLMGTMHWENIDKATLEAAFNAFDVDKDGTISAKELKFMLEDVDDEMDEQVWDDLLKEGDHDKDGCVTSIQIDIDDFRKMIIKRIATKVSAPGRFQDAIHQCSSSPTMPPS